METFKVGDKVRCIDASKVGNITLGNEYVISKIGINPDVSKYRIYLVGLADWCYYYPHRFELITKTDMKPKEIYNQLAEQAFKLLDIKVGDIVKVTGKVEPYLFGWSNTWSLNMDKFIGQEQEVKTLPRNGQLNLGGYNYPFFVIEIVRRGKVLPEPIVVSDSYNAVFNQDGSVNVGCQKVSFETLTKIYETAKSLR